MNQNPSLITSLAFALSVGFILPAVASAKIAVGDKPPLVVLSDKSGEKLNGGGWNSNVIGGKVTVVMYVDPDKNSSNEHVEKAIRDHYTRKDIKVFGVVNTEATFIPNFMLRRRLSAKQNRNPLVDLVLDYERVLEKKWGLLDDRYNVMVFDKEGTLFFLKEGVLSESEVAEMLAGMKSHGAGVLESGETSDVKENRVEDVSVDTASEP
jgi:predicted transcriptional regulator